MTKISKLSQTKKFRREICRATGHDWGQRVRLVEEGSGGYTAKVCSRCKKKELVSAWNNPKIKYSELSVRKFSILDRTNKPEKK